MSYNGLHFSGFAQQPGQPTVQGSLNNALRILYRRQVETTCAGRTDAGVHAKGQVVSFDVSPSELQGRPLPGLLRSLNALIDDNAAILAIEERAPGFSARFDARSREYRYLIATGEARPVLLADRVWHLGRPLDLEAMRDAAAYLIGEHDFKSFCKAVSAQDKPTNRKVMQIAVEEECLMGENLVVIKVVGNAFLHSMVRTIVGTMVAIGLGNRPARWAQDVLLACDRRAAGQTAPAHGLVFWQVSY
jgi:tRNA pseudouridine38-40 synthase